MKNIWGRTSPQTNKQTNKQTDTSILWSDPALGPGQLKKERKSLMEYFKSMVHLFFTPTHSPSPAPDPAPAPYQYSPLLLWEEQLGVGTYGWNRVTLNCSMAVAVMSRIPPFFKPSVFKNNPAAQASRLQAQTLPNATPPLGKIPLFTKIALTWTNEAI